MAESTNSQIGNRSDDHTRGGDARTRGHYLRDWLANYLSPIQNLARLSAVIGIYLGVLIATVSGVGLGISLIRGFAGVVALFTVGLALIAAAPTLAGWMATIVLSTKRRILRYLTLKSTKHPKLII